MTGQIGTCWIWIWVGPSATAAATCCSGSTSCDQGDWYYFNEEGQFGFNTEFARIHDFVAALRVRKFKLIIASCGDIRGNYPLVFACIGHISLAVYALISVMARLMEVKLPAHFGVAPSTVAHHKATATK